MSQTGINGSEISKRPIKARKSSKHPKGFTLLEVLVTVSILALATVFISRTNLLSAAVFGRYANLLEIQNWAAEKIWNAKESILTEEFPETGMSQGVIEGATRPYRWQLITEQKGEKLTELYEISLQILWKEGGHDNRLERYGALMKVKDE